MSKQQIEQELAKARQEISRLKSAPANMSPQDELAQVRAEITKLRSGKTSQPSTDDFNWLRGPAEAVARGALSVPDFIALAGRFVGHPVTTYRQVMGKEEDPYSGRFQNTALAALKKAGVDLNTQKAKTPTQRILGQVVPEFLGAAAVPLGGVSRGTSALGTLANYAKGVGKTAPMAATAGAITGGLEEARVPPLVAGITGIATAPLLAKAARLPIKAYRNKVAGSTEAERHMAEYFDKTMSPEERALVSTNLTNYNLANAMSPEERALVTTNLADTPIYEELANYEPTTAEISGGASMPQLYRMRKPITGSGLAEREGTQSQIMHEAFRRNAHNPAGRAEPQTWVQEKLCEHQAARDAATAENYALLDEMTQPVDITEPQEFLNENRFRRGPVGEEVQQALRDIRPRMGVEAAQPRAQLSEAAQREADRIIQNVLQNPSISAEQKQSFLASVQDLLPPPEPPQNLMQVRELRQYVSDINKKMRENTAKGQGGRNTFLWELKHRLENALDEVPLHAETRNLYRELSGPVEEITGREYTIGGAKSKPPVTKGILVSRANDILSHHIFSGSNSLRNARELRNVFRNDPQIWSRIQDATVDLIRRRITNTGVSGGERNLSMDKLNNLIENHGAAINEVLSPKQGQFLRELNKAMQGRNAAATEGSQPQSITTANLENAFGISTPWIERFPRVGDALKKVHKVGPTVKDFLKIYYNWQKGNMMKTVDKVLRDPEYARKIMDTKWQNQHQFNTYLQDLSEGIKASPTTTQDKRHQNE